MKFPYINDNEQDDPSELVWDDGEWVDLSLVDYEDDDEWDDAGEYTSIFQTKKPDPSTLQLWELLAELVEASKTYIEVTGRHLPIYGELGELYGEIKYGIKRHKAYAAGSDGRLGNDFVEVKTITPEKKNNTVLVKRSGNFNKLLIVKISVDFQFKALMVDRKDLNKGTGKYARVSWSKFQDHEK